MIRTKSSIKSSLLKFLIIPFILFSIPISLYIHYTVSNKINSFFDNRLLLTAKNIENNLEFKDGKTVVNFAHFPFELYSSFDERLLYYSIVDAQGTLLDGSIGLFNKTAIKQDEIAYFETRYAGSRVKAITYAIYHYKDGNEFLNYITVGESLDERVGNVDELFNLVLLVVAVTFLSAIMITILAVRQGLKPLHILESKIKKRGKNNLKPLLFDAPSELENVVHSINKLLTKSRNTIKHTEQFNADVSHQIRTSLSEIKMELELLYAKNNNKEDYEVLKKYINNTIHTTEQILLFAKTNPDTINFKRFKKINLNLFCKEYCKKIASKVYANGFEFEFVDFDEDLYIQAEPILLESMLDNLIDNAFNYAVDEYGKPIGTISLILQKFNNAIWLSIKDEGRGVDKKYLKNIFARYYRVALDKQGTGIGLSIVKQIANLHNARTIAMVDNGLKVSIIFK